MHKGYGNRFVSVSTCVCYCASGYIPGLCISKVRQHTVSCKLLKICIVWTSLKTFRLGDMASFAHHNDRRLDSFSIKNKPILLGMITNGMVYELLAKNDNYIN